MIIDPVINRLDSTGLQNADYDHKQHGEVANDPLPNSEEESPPSYTEIDLERGVIERLEAPLSGYSHTTQFCRMEYDEGSLNIKGRSPGIRKVTEGTKDIFRSIVLLMETSFLALGACVEGCGKIIHGVGMIIQQHRTLSSLPDN